MALRGEFGGHHPIEFAPGPSLSPSLRNDRSTSLGVWSKAGLICITLPPALSSPNQPWEAKPQILLEVAMEATESWTGFISSTLTTKYTAPF